MANRQTTSGLPMACRPEAFAHVREQLPRLATTEGLLQAAVGVSMHALDDVVPHSIDREIERMARAVQRQCRSANASALVAHLHDVLFVQEGFQGSSQERYYSPLNSYLPAVLRLKRGIPITLALLYKTVAERVELKAEGIAAPGHFLVRVHDGAGWMVVDPFHGGRVLTLAEACALVSAVIGETVEPNERYLPTATHEQWLTRVIANLANAFHAMGRQHDLQAMQELHTLVQHNAR